MKTTVIAGSGLSALMLARMIKLYRNPDANIFIFEKEWNILENNYKETKPPAGSNAYQIRNHHFGKLITDEIMVPGK